MLFPHTYSPYPIFPHSSLPIQPNIVAAPNGAWRNYGLGMVCLYQSDFKSLSGFSKTITGWGREDVDFYERVVKNGAIEVRMYVCMYVCMYIYTGCYCMYL